MLAISDQHDHFTPQKPNRTATSMGLGLVRRLLDAGRTEEARTTLASLQNGFQTVEEQAEKPSQKHCKVNRLKGVSRRVAILPLSAKLQSVQWPN